MLNLFKIDIKIFLVISSLFFVACGGSGKSTFNGREVVDEDSNSFKGLNRKVAIDNSKAIYRIDNVKSGSLTIDVKSKKDLYVLVTSKFDNQNISIGLSKTNDIVRNRVINDSNKSIDLIKMRREINNILFSKEATPRYRVLSQSVRDINSINLGAQERFCIGMNSDRSCSMYINATVKRVVKNIQTPYGLKSLVVWLQNGNSLSQSSLEKLSNIFLKPGGNNDIYDWESNIFGSEWGDDAQKIDSKLIPKSDIIDILVYNMNNIGLAGYFWGKDNFKKSSIGASNEKIMFYINSELLKRDPKETYTTLVHEFQHMIHFYQRSVIKGIEDSSWYDELMSESIEDLISTKIGYMGPRHVNPNDGSAGKPGNRGGRYPNFNRYNSISLTSWYNTTKDYSKVSSFGAFLLRNYNGATLLNKMMYSNYQDEYALLDVTGENNFGNLIAKWGSAVILSDRLNAPNGYRYNFGTFQNSSFRGVTYRLGSINFYNYIPSPRFRSSAYLDKNANLYYKIGNNLKGLYKIDLNIPKGATLTVIAK